MKLKTAMSIAKELGLKTVKEAILNIEIHCGMIFEYSEIDFELNELYSDFKLSGLSFDDLIDEEEI